mmetsp:Transcript_32694/g.81993  ORF Transcript_32694/g.81993 Transcript_32694/m.81993 type:complete len:207 (+) Transcript_32694:629-1249(+)
MHPSLHILHKLPHQLLELFKFQGLRGEGGHFVRRGKDGQAASSASDIHNARRRGGPEEREAGLCHPECAKEVGVHCDARLRRERRVRDLAIQCGIIEADGCIVDQDIQTPLKVVVQEATHGGNAGRISEVQLLKDDIAAGGGELGCRRGAELLVAAAQNNRESLCGAKPPRDLLADAFVGTGHQRNPPVRGWRGRSDNFSAHMPHH